MVPNLQKLDPARFETPAILKRVAAAGRALAELKGVVGTIPHQDILISTLTIQEAKDSSEIENIVTTHDQLYQRESADDQAMNAATKEVLRYREALWTGYQAVRNSGLLTNNQLLDIHAALEANRAGFRKVPGTTLKNRAGEVVYTPPQSGPEVEAYMADLEKFIHMEPPFDADPLVRMALIHHQFESIHPFYDGNGRTGRILNVLYLVKEGLLDVPVLYLSRYIVRTKSDYYRLLQAVREDDAWGEWVLYMLTAVEDTARDATRTVGMIREAFLDAKHRIRSRFRFYSQDLINNLFTHPYTKIAFVERDLNVTRLTATRYLDELAEEGFLEKRKIGRSNYYLNQPLIRILTRS
jgi:Fic family protein